MYSVQTDFNVDVHKQVEEIAPSQVIITCPLCYKTFYNQIEFKMHLVLCNIGDDPIISDMEQVDYTMNGIAEESEECYNPDDLSEAHDLGNSNDDMNIPDSIDLTRELDEYEFIEDDGASTHLERNKFGSKNGVRRKSGKIYINQKVFDDVEVTKAESVPAVVDGLCVFQVPQLQTLSNCKGNRPWGRAQSNKSSTFTRGPRLLFSCRGSYICQNLSCPNVEDFGFNRTDFIRSNDKITCSICRKLASYISCEARLYIEENLDTRVNTVKHYGVHTCLVKILGQPDKEEIKEIIRSFPKITREGIVRQKISAKVQSDGFNSAVEEAKQYTNTKFIDNIKAKEKSLSQPFGHSFNRVLGQSR